jgi:endonuclease III
MDTVECLLSTYPLYSEDLNIDLTKPRGRFQWFLASILFGARISEKIATRTFLAFREAGIDTPEKILPAGWDNLVKILDSGGYARYDFSTATKLVNIMSALRDRYESLEELYDRSSNTEDLQNRLQEFKGIGPVTAQIFLREMRGIWDINPDVSDKALQMEDWLCIDLKEFSGEKLSRVETALIKLYLRCCKKKRCPECPISECPRRVIPAKIQEIRSTPKVHPKRIDVDQ